MKIESLTYVALAAVLLAIPAAGEFSIEGQDDYCLRYGITFWCTDEGVQALETFTPEGLSHFRYINDYAFGDEVRYTGELMVRRISVLADLTQTSSVEATYEIENTGDEDVTAQMVALQTPIDTELYENGQRIDVDPLLEGWDSTFAPGEKKEIKLVFSEPLYGDIFGYNVNLLFDEKTIDNHITPTGSFVFRLPRGAVIEQCVPSGYTTKTENGRLTVSWTKTDFVPWTNPFNDLICKWNIGEAAAATGESAQPAPADNSWAIWLIIVVFALGTVVWLYRTGRLDDLLNR